MKASLGNEIAGWVEALLKRYRLSKIDECSFKR